MSDDRRYETQYDSQRAPHYHCLQHLQHRQHRRRLSSAFHSEHRSDDPQSPVITIHSTSLCER